jgi:hypothetical protein
MSFDRPNTPGPSATPSGWAPPSCGSGGPSRQQEPCQVLWKCSHRRRHSVPAVCNRRPARPCHEERWICCGPRAATASRRHGRAESPAFDSLGWSERRERSPRLAPSGVVEGCRPGPRRRSRVRHGFALTALGVFREPWPWGFTPGCRIAGFQPFRKGVAAPLRQPLAPTLSPAGGEGAVILHPRHPRDSRATVG